MPSRVLQPAAHLVCYQTKDVDRFRPRRVRVTNQFGTRDLTVRRPATLCVPSLKRSGFVAPDTMLDLRGASTVSAATRSLRSRCRGR